MQEEQEFKATCRYTELKVSLARDLFQKTKTAEKAQHYVQLLLRIQHPYQATHGGL